VADAGCVGRILSLENKIPLRAVGPALNWGRYQPGGNWGEAGAAR
jgi:hypothetical protein